MTTNQTLPTRERDALPHGDPVEVVVAMIDKHPLIAVGIGLVAGYLVARLLNR